MSDIPGVPEGWRLVRIGAGEPGEWTIDYAGVPVRFTSRGESANFPIIERIERIEPAWQPPPFPDECRKPWVAGICYGGCGWTTYGLQPTFSCKYWRGGGRYARVNWLGLPPVPKEHWENSWVPNPCYDPTVKWPE